MYQANTLALSGDPGSGYLLWDNSSQISATQINVSHTTDNGIDVDIFLALLRTSESITIQNQTTSADYQTWTISASPTNINPGAANSYWTIPVTYVASGGVGASNFPNNTNLFLALVNGPQGSTGPTGPQGDVGATGVTGATGPQGDVGATGAGTSGFSGFSGISGFSGLAGLDPWQRITSTSTLTSGNRVIADTTGGAFTLNLPATPVVGSYVIITDGGDWTTTNLTVGRNGSSIEGVVTDLLVTIGNVTLEFIYDGTTWQFTISTGPQGQSGFSGFSGVSFTDGQSISVNNFTITGAFTADSSTGTSGQVLASSSTGVYWSPAPVTATSVDTLTNKRIDPRVSSTASATSVTPDISSFDMYVYTALAAGLTINATTGGSPVNGSKLMFRFEDDGTPRALNWTTSGSNSFRVIGVTLPTTTVATKTTYVGCIYNAADAFWDVVASVTQA